LVGCCRRTAIMDAAPVPIYTAAADSAAPPPPPREAPPDSKTEAPPGYNNSTHGAQVTMTVVFPHGVSYRASPQYDDRVNTISGPACGAAVTGSLVRGADGIEYICIAGDGVNSISVGGGYFLPTTDTQFQVLLQKPQEAAPAVATRSVRNGDQGTWMVVFPQGVGYRVTPTFEAKHPSSRVTGPVFGEMVTGRVRVAQGIIYIQCNKTGYFVPMSNLNGSIVIMSEVQPYTVCIAAGVGWRNGPIYNARVDGPGPVCGQHLSGAIIVQAQDGMSYLMAVTSSQTQLYLPMSTQQGVPTLTPGHVQMQPQEQVLNQDIADIQASYTAPPEYASKAI